MRKLLVSVSGGRTSALMAYLLWTRFKSTYEMVFVFANTSREKEETLVFVHNLEKHFGMPIVWVEAVVHKGRKGCTHKIVSFETAKRDGSVFEAVIAKYGIPNQHFKHCTRELKTNPIRSYMRSIGWKDYKKYTTVIGYRADEPARVNLINAEKERQWYPLFEWGIKKPDVAVFWLKQDFDLGLQDFDGNCKKCHKKSDYKILMQVATDPSDTWTEEMEQKYGYYTGNRDVSKFKPPYNFFRHNRSLQDIKDEYQGHISMRPDKSLSIIGSDYDFDLHEQEDCSESCEPF